MQPELLKECWKSQRYATFSGKYIYKYFYVEKQFEELGNSTSWNSRIIWLDMYAQIEESKM